MSDCFSFWQLLLGMVLGVLFGRFVMGRKKRRLKMGLEAGS